MREKTKILMATAVWGDWYINAYLAVNLPSLIAPGNLPELTRGCDLTYRLYTRRSDVSRLMSSPVMQAISRMMPVEVEILSEEKLAHPIAAHQWAWEQAMAAAKDSGRFILFMPPDVAWANGSFAHVADLLAEGKKAIFMTYLRVVSETFVPAFQDRSEGAQGAITMTGTDMVALSLRHMHPLMAAYCHDSLYFPSHAEMILWPVRSEGLLVRVLAREMFLYDPGHIGLTPQLLMDGDCGPREVAFIDDSDKLFAVSLAPLGKDISWHMEYRKATPLTLARWWLVYDSPSNDFVAGTHIRWHTGKPTAKLWRRQERRSDHLIRDAIAAREGVRIWRELNAMECHMAASILALATGMGLLAKAISNPSPATIFVPSDNALRQLSEETINNLAEPQNVRHLITFLRHHVAFETNAGASLYDRLRLENPASLALKTAAGYPLTIERSEKRLTVNGLEILEPERRVGRYMVYKINDVLAPNLAVVA